MRRSQSATCHSPEFYVTEEYDFILFGITLYHSERIIKGPLYDRREARKYVKKLRAIHNLKYSL